MVVGQEQGQEEEEEHRFQHQSISQIFEFFDRHIRFSEPVKNQFCFL